MRSALAEALPVVETLVPLTADEARRLKECEKVIQRGLHTFYEVGNALTDIRDSRLYRMEYSTFEQYCRERWQMSKSHANRLIDSAEVIANLTPIGVTPTNESQARELASLEPAVQRAVWQIAVRTAPTNDQGEPSLTAAHIKSVGEVLSEVVRSGGLDDGSGEIKPLGQLIDAAVTEETYERMMRQKEYIRAAKEKEHLHVEKQAKGEIELLYTAETQDLLTRYMDVVKQFEEETTVPHLRLMFQTHKAHAHDQKKRNVEDDCENILKVIKDTRDVGHDGDIDANDLYRWLIDLGYFMGESEYRARLEYMNQADKRMALLTDAGDGRQDDRRGKLPWIVCIPWRKIWDQGSKRERESDDEWS